MTGWNLPPGCEVSDIPGNRPDDILSEKIYDHMSPADMEELCAEKNALCEHAVEDDDRDFIGCMREVVNSFIKVKEEAEFSKCPFVEEWIAEKVEASKEGPEYEPENKWP
jgi:hypothetical protein